ncbi:MAG: VOC family protein [Rubrobacteraceae bacterium]|nr:VOC family protein [Rubrobacter sp.]
MLEVRHLDHIALTVTDVERSARWYEEVLGLERRHEEVWGGRPLMVCAGETCLALFPPDGTISERASSRTTLSMRHFAFRVDRENFAAAQERLEELGISYTFEDHEICHSVYFPDPDGHRVELTTFEI